MFFLGAPRFELGKQTVELTTAKAIALLGYLAATREPQTRDRLLGLLWAESADNAARKNLRNTLWTIRKALGDKALVADDDRLAINQSTWVDVWGFEQISDSSSEISILKSKIDLYRAPFLDGLVLADAPEFEIWLTGERERIAQLNLHALSALVDSYQRDGNWRAVIETAQRALSHDSLQEPMHRARMEAHARLGERAEALRQYDTLRATLERELGVAPLPETDALRAAIVNGECVGPKSLAPLHTGAAQRQSPATDKTAAPYIGRRVERNALDEELETAMSGTARVVLLTGEIGIGKSRLWQEWSATLSAETTVLSTRCLDSMQSLPFAPLTELFSRREIMQQLFTAPSPVPSIWLAEVARLLPQIRQRFPDLPAPAALPPDEERRRLFEAFAQCLLALARPIVFFVDDAHWADRATLDWLGYLANALRDHALLLIVAYRPEDAPAPLIRLAAGWGREGVVRRVPLVRLTNAESAALIVALGGDPALAERTHAQTAGNPYFLIELTRSGSDQVSPVLAELVRARLDRLPETAHQVLQAAAVLAPDFDFAALRRTSGRGEEETLAALDTLLNAALLTERNSHYEFSHPLVATVVQNGLSGARRAFLNRRAAEALEATHAGRLPQIAGRLAARYADAGDASRAAHFAEMAAEHALALAATNEAESFYRQALALEPMPARQLGLGRVLMRGGELTGARESFETALRGFEAAGDRKGAARAALSISETLFPAGRFDEGRQWTEKGITYLEEEGDFESHAWAHLLLGMGPDAEEHLNHATRHAIENNLPDIGARSQFLLGTVRAERGDLAGALKAYQESIAFARIAGNDYQEILGYNNLAYHALLAGDLATAHENVEKGLALAEARAIRLPLQYLYSTRGEIALAEKKWDEAETWFERGLAQAEANGNVEQAAGYHVNQALVARGRGDLDGALMLLETARESAVKVHAPHVQIQVELRLAELYLLRGERVAAAQALGRAEKMLAGSQRRGLLNWAERLKKEIE
jgi:DNA-binding SARP family transcriptional activator